jgi:hypothetical protein
MSDDYKRIRALAERVPYTAQSPEGEALVQLARERFGRAVPICDCRTRNRDCIMNLRFIQAWALYEIGLKRGLLGAVGVGHGKTLMDLLAPLALPGCQRAVLLVPPGLVGQLIAEYELLRQHWKVPSLISHAKQKYNARVAGAPALHIFPYSLLSRHEASGWLTDVKPDLIIADEVHKLRSPDTATTARVLRYFSENPACRFIGWTGSLTDSSLHDYSHLAALALRHQSPLPLDPQVISEWATAISTDKDMAPRPPGVLLELCEPGEHVRDGFRRRLRYTEGFVSTQDASVDVDMEIHQRIIPAIPETIRGLLADLRNTWARPDGEELTDALAVFRCARELACGMYYRWRFPRGEPVHVIMEWLKRRKTWNSFVRDALFAKREHLDSPYLVQLACMRHDGDLPRVAGKPTITSHGYWQAWKEIRDEVKPESEAVRVDDFLVRDASEWAHANKGIVWYDISDFGSWLADVSGLPRFGGGVHAPRELLKERGDRSILCSIKAHGTGRDGLQRLFNQQLVAQPPGSSDLWEQLLGRLHRQGQDRDVFTFFYRHTSEMASFVDQALARAAYVQATLGNQQKIIKYKMAESSARDLLNLPPPTKTAQFHLETLGGVIGT